jgi:hypothetical protein
VSAEEQALARLAEIDAKLTDLISIIETTTRIAAGASR